MTPDASKFPGWYNFIWPGEGAPPVLQTTPRRFLIPPHVFGDGGSIQGAIQAMAQVVLCALLRRRHVFFCHTYRPERLRDVLTDGRRQVLDHAVAMAGALGLVAPGEPPEALSLALAAQPEWPLNLWLALPLTEPSLFSRSMEAALRLALPRLVVCEVTQRHLLLEPWVRNVYWVVAHGQAGQKALSPPRVDTVRALRDAAVGAGVPFFFGGWGDLCPNSQARLLAGPQEQYLRLGWEASGRELDGQEWQQVPAGMAEVVGG